MTENKQKISSAFPYQYHFVDVCDSQMAYIEEGEGNPILFIHGMPASSYLWRNVIPQVAKRGRCIAVDLIGCGKSGKPAIDYTLQDHIRYLDAFIKKLGLTSMTLVMHAWGGVIGLSYAMQHPELFKGLVFFETQLRPVDSWDMIALPVQQWATSLRNIKDAYQKIASSTFYIDRIFPSGVMRRLQDEEMHYYREPFLAENSRKPILTWLRELPLGDKSNTTSETIRAYSEALQYSMVPKLMLYAEPGFTTTMDSVAWAKKNLPNLSLAFIGEDLHYPQETKPEVIAQAICQWSERQKL